jgi:hypothetical protein
VFGECVHHHVPRERQSKRRGFRQNHPCAHDLTSRTRHGGRGCGAPAASSGRFVGRHSPECVSPILWVAGVSTAGEFQLPAAALHIRNQQQRRLNRPFDLPWLFTCVRAQQVVRCGSHACVRACAQMQLNRGARLIPPNTKCQGGGSRSGSGVETRPASLTSAHSRHTSNAKLE